MSNGIGSFCTRQVITVAPDATVVEASKLMRQHHVGAVVMVDDRGGARKPLGVLTDRDIAMEVVALGVAPETLKVSEVVQRPVTTVVEDAGYAETVRLMSVNGVRRMPVVDRGGNLVGIIAVDDILRQLAGPLLALCDLVARERDFERSMRR
ncbi:MAG TPA: CBS domain-containing protein [Casimicrobiaceae bacterium]|nr:CBS domain-containing protein [Casimicrobiaceae bacterium]